MIFHAKLEDFPHHQRSARVEDDWQGAERFDDFYHGSVISLRYAMGPLGVWCADCMT